MSPLLPTRVIFPFVGDTVGGSHISTLHLAKYLANNGVQVDVVAHQPGPIFYELMSGHPARVHELPVRVPGYRRDQLILGALRNRQVVKDFLTSLGSGSERTIVHTNDLRSHVIWLLGTAAAGVAQVWHSRQLYSHGLHERLFFYRYPAGFIAVSDFVAHSAPEAIRHRQYVVPNTFGEVVEVNRGASKIALYEELGISPGTKLVGFFGNYQNRKNPIFFAKIAVELARVLGGGVAFAMFGDDRQNVREEIDAIAARGGISERFFQLGFRSAALSCIAACDLAVIPAEQEPFGRVLVEAMHVGTPVIAADSGGHCEILHSGVNGLLVPPGDLDGFVRAAAELLGNEAQHRMIAERARRDVMTQFSLDSHGSRVCAVYDRLLRESSAAAVGTYPLLAGAR